jgi:hypothetical protein
VLLEPSGVEREVTRKRKNADGVMKAQKGVTHEPDVPAILELCRNWLPDIFVVEKVNAMPGKNKDGTARRQGTASIFGLGHSAGLLTGIGHGISLNGITQVRTIRPQEWRGAWSLPEGKEQSRLVASRIFPSRAVDFKFVSSHNVADPLLMAMLIWHRETGTPLPLGRV